MEFDPKQWELEDVSVLTVRNARGDDYLLGSDGEPVTMEIYSPGSQIGRRANFKAKRGADLRTFRAFRGEYGQNDQENAERERAEKLVAITKSISANCPLTVQQIFSNPRLYYWHDQVDEHFGKSGNFMKGPSPSSP